MTDTQKKTITISVTINDKYDHDLYWYLVTVDSRRRGFMVAELCKKGIALDKSMWRQPVELIDGTGILPQNERAGDRQKTPNHVAVEDGANNDPFADDLKALVDS